MRNREYIYIAPEGFLNSESINGFNKALIDAITLSNTKKFLFDTSKIDVIERDGLQWLINTISPYLIKNKFSKVTFIEPENIFGIKSVERLSNALKNSISVKTFLNIELAEHWLFQN